MPRFIVCNAAWSESYRGERMQGSGGSYVVDRGDGAEKFNFAPHNRRVYGYVAAPGGTIDCDRIAGRALLRQPNPLADGVTVVWCARNPHGGVFVVGWYQDATVFRRTQPGASVGLERRRLVNGDPWEFNIETEEGNAFLLRPDQRALRVPRGGHGKMGQSNVWYAESPEGRAFQTQVQTLMSTYRTGPAPS